MRQSRYPHLSVTLAALVSTVAFAQPATDVPTLLKGHQQRQERFQCLAGRIVIGRKGLTADKPEPQPSLTVVDFARDGAAFRIEQREVIMPTMRWTLAYDGLLRPEPEGTPPTPRQLYASFVCDGKTTWRYDRSANRSSVAAASGRVYSPAAESIDGSATTAFGNMIGDMTLRSIFEGKLPATLQGVDNLEGHECYRILADSGWRTSPEGPGRHRTYLRVWIAPSLDYGGVRSEQVQVSDKGLISCVVKRARGWAKDARMDLWMPASYQMDHFAWMGVKEMGLRGPGWDRTQAIGRIALTNKREEVVAALPLRYPFDCEIVKRTGEQTVERTDDPTLWPAELTPLLSYQPPDEFGMKLTPTTDLNALFGVH